MERYLRFEFILCPTFRLAATVLFIVVHLKAKSGVNIGLNQMYMTNLQSRKELKINEHSHYWCRWIYWFSFS